MFRRTFLCSAAHVGALSGLNFEVVSDAKALEPTVEKLMRESEKRQGLVDLPAYNRRDFGFTASTKDGRLAGGLLGFTNYNELHIAMLAINPEVAVCGAGSRLLKAAEEAARFTYKCNRLALETFDWQARPFYERFGFEVFGTQRDQPVGHEKYFMEKVWPAEKSAEAPTCYTIAAEELTLGQWSAEAATPQLVEWLNGDARRRQIPNCPPYDMTPFGLRITNEGGELVAACLYETWWDELHVDKLVVVPDQQGKGIGSAVLKRLEETAREKKLRHLIADAMSWQAYPFYEKHGLKIFATQKDVSKGHAHLRLQRVLE